MDIPRICHAYTSYDISWISMDIPCIDLVNKDGIFMDIQCLSTPIHMHAWIYHVYSMYMDEDPINMEYTMHIPGIYRKYWFQMSGLTWCASAMILTIPITWFCLIFAK
jgi:hypothetical protein